MIRDRDAGVQPISLAALVMICACLLAIRERQKRQQKSKLRKRYVQYINRTYRRTGTLWDSRFKSSLVQADDCLLLCQHYIELNPVRAAMVDDPADYRWSSYRATGLGQADALLTRHEAYLGLGRNEDDRLATYRDLFRSELDAAAIDDIRMALSQGQPLGNSRFLDSIGKTTRRRFEARPRGRPRKPVEQEA